MSEHEEKIYITAEDLLRDSLPWGCRSLKAVSARTSSLPSGVGGTPVGIAVQELLKYAAVDTDHIAIRTSYYHGIDKTHSQVQVHNLGYLLENLDYEHSVLIVDDVFDRGRSIEAIINELKRLTRRNMPKDIRVATVWFKPEKNVTNLVPDYYVHETSRWLVFPHELDGLSESEVMEGKPVIADLVLRAKAIQNA